MSRSAVRVRSSALLFSCSLQGKRELQRSSRTSIYRNPSAKRVVESIPGIHSIAAEEVRVGVHSPDDRRTTSLVSALASYDAANGSAVLIPDRKLRRG
jgi:hypothetical protein